MMESPEKEMSFLDHLEELRWHLVRSAIAVGLVTVTAFVYSNFIFDTVIFGPMQTDFWTYRMLCFLEQRTGFDLCIDSVSFSLINTELSGQFMMHMWTSFICGVVVAFPYLLWEIWRFVKPALKDLEVRYTRGVVFSGSLLFMTGVLFGYYILAPMSINFLGSYQVSGMVKNMISMDSFISTVTILTLATGIVFEMPLVIYFLSKLGIMTPSFMRRYRKHAVVVILIMAAVITPTPDVTGMILVAIPLYFLYEISIFVSGTVAAKQKTA